MDLSIYTISELKEIIRNYNDEHRLKDYSKLKKSDLDNIMRKFLKFVNGSLYGISKEVKPPKNISKTKNILKKIKMNNKQRDILTKKYILAGKLYNQNVTNVQQNKLDKIRQNISNKTFTIEKTLVELYKQSLLQKDVSKSYHKYIKTEISKLTQSIRAKSIKK
jgi:hypothetical protein